MRSGLVLRGRPSPSPTGSVRRALAPEDLEWLASRRGVPAPALKRLSQRHHAVARALASGVANQEAALMSGLTEARISLLRNDPSFQDLVAFYSERVDVAYADLHQRLARLSVEAADILHERMEEAPDELTTGQVIEIIKMGADRTGHGPSNTTQVTVNVALADRLEAARKRLADRRTIDL